MSTAARPRAFVVGASGGIGTPLVRGLDRRGYALMLADRSEDGAAQAAHGLSAAPEATFACDLEDPAARDALCARVADAAPDLDVLVYNAGYIRAGPLASLEPAVIDRHLAINLAGAMHVLRAAVPGMAERGRGRILVTVSLGGILALKHSTAYTAAKFGLRGFLSALSQEVRPLGVTVSGVYPAGVDTGMLRHEALDGGNLLNFLSRPLEPAKVAETALRAMEKGRLETYVPFTDGISTRLAGAFPWAVPHILPVFERLGERGRRRYLRERGLDAE